MSDSNSYVTQLERLAGITFHCPIVDVESLFFTFDWSHEWTDPIVRLIETTAYAPYGLTNGHLKQAIRHAVHLWQIDLGKQGGRYEAIPLLFHLERVCDPGSLNKGRHRGDGSRHLWK